MKKAIAFAILLIISVTSFCQQTKPSPALTKQDYLEKSKNQKKAARIVLYGGASCIAISFLIPKGEVIDPYNIINFFPHKNSGVKTAFFLSGFLSTLISLPIFSASSRNKWKARASNAFLKMETAPIYQGYGMTHISYPALSVKINLR